MNPEEMVVGACMLTPDSIRFASDTLTPEDFHDKRLAGAFRAIVHLVKADQPVEPMSVHAKAQAQGVRGLELAELFQMMENVGSASSIGFYADQVREAATRRHLSSVAQRLMREAVDKTMKPAEAAQAAKEALAELRENGRMATKTLAEILAVEDDYDWLIPGLLEKGDRVIITGFEGAGKTTWVRQMVICMAAGIHPITLNNLESALKVLVIDAENTESQWRKQTRRMVHVAKTHGSRDPGPAIEVFAGKRIDITKDATLGEIHRLVDIHQPDVLCIGPLYKLVTTGINNDQEAAPLITALDSLRDRGLALIMEAHAPKGSAQNPARDLAPRGSAALMGWPEFGFGLYPDAPLEEGKPSSRSFVTRWRGDRDTGRDWPTELWKGGQWPWSADNITDQTRQKFYSAA
jgi:hypothetical protein